MKIMVMILAGGLGIHAPAFSETLARATIQARMNIPRFRLVAPGIYAGGNPLTRARGTDGLEALVALNIRTLISLQGGDIDGTWRGHVSHLWQKGENLVAISAQAFQLRERQVAFHNFPLSSRNPKSETEDRSIREILEMMARATPESPIYIHCQFGSDRTGLLIALYRYLYQGWSVEEAYAEWVRHGHGRISRYFTRALDAYFIQFIAEEPRRILQPVGADPDAKCEEKL